MTFVRMSFVHRDLAKLFLPDAVSGVTFLMRLGVLVGNCLYAMNMNREY